MKHHVLLLFTLLLLVSVGIAQTPSALSPGARLLVANEKSRLTVAEKNQRCRSLGLSVSNGKKQLVLTDDAMANFPYSVSGYPTDLNQAGAEDVFVLYGNSVLWGNAGADVVLFTKDRAGVYQKKSRLSGSFT